MRHVIHVIISLLMWGLFGYYWYLVSLRTVGRETLDALAVFGLLILAGLVLTIGWVAHNKRIARRNRRRGQPAVAAAALTADSLARPVVAPPLAELQAAANIDIDVDDAGRKVYTIVAEEGG